jgi:Co/Zn/Cd efflux system component
VTEEKLNGQSRVLGWLGAIALTVVIVSWSLDWTPGYIIASCLTAIVFLWGLSLSDQEAHLNRLAFEKRYAAMNDTQKIDYHLDRSRRLGTNHDANIAQALIEKGRK